MRFVFFGLSIASAWGSGHATTYRGLVRELHRRGHHITFFERRFEWYDHNCDLPQADYCDIRRYETWPAPGAAEAVRDADVVVLGSLAADGIAIAGWLPDQTRAVLAYYDIDTPVTLQRFADDGRTDYILPAQLSRFDVVLSFAGGPALDALRRWGSRRAEALYCAVDPTLYYPAAPDPRYACDLGYMGTYAGERQDAVDELFLAPARLRPQRRFVVAGAQYPDEITRTWPGNVTHFIHVNPVEHPAFFAGCAWQLKVVRAPMRLTGWSPSVTLFEAAACGAPLISDDWPGLDEFLAPGREALVAQTRDDVVGAFEVPEAERRSIGAAARAHILREHTYAQRVDWLEQLLAELGAPGADGARGAPMEAPVS